MYGSIASQRDATNPASAQLGAHGPVRGSLVPPGPIRELRDLTRARTATTWERAREIQRLDKLLEDAGVKLSLGRHRRHRRVPPVDASVSLAVQG